MRREAAEKLGAGVITADRMLYEQGKRIYKRVTLLGSAASR